MRKNFLVFAQAALGRAQLPSNDNEHLTAVRNELQLLVPRYAGKSSKAQVAGAELIIRTAFAKQRMAGQKCCAGEVASSAIAFLPPAEAARACTTCLEHRLHFLASEDFCHFTFRASTDKPVTLAAGSELAKQITRSFGSVYHFEQELRTFSLSKAVPGWVWIVWNLKAKTDVSESNLLRAEESVSNARGRLEIVSFPGNMTPLAVGLWPIGCLNLSDRAVTLEYAAETSRRESSATILSEPPAWSRAARNSEAARTRAPAEQPITLDMLRSQLVGRYLASLNYGFLSKQLEAALEQFSTGAHDAKVAANLKSVAEVVKNEFLQHQPQVTLIDEGAWGDTPLPEVATAPVEAEPPAEPMGLAEVFLEKHQELAASSEKTVSQSLAGESVAVTTDAQSAEPPVAEFTRTLRDDGTTIFTYSDTHFVEVSPDESRVVTHYDGVVTTEDKAARTVTWRYQDGSEVFQGSDGKVRRTDAAGNVTFDSQE